MKKRSLLVTLTVLLLLQCAAIPIRSAETPQFSVTVELYDADAVSSGGKLPGTAQPIDPLRLRVGQQVIAAVRYEGFDAMEAQGIECLAVSLSYDERCLALSGFAPGTDGGTVTWTTAGAAASARWLPNTLETGYKASASDRATETEGFRRVYIQYISEKKQTGDTVCADNEGYFGAFTFTVKREIDPGEGVYIRWADYAMGLYSDTEYNISANCSRAVLDADPRFRRPQDILIATSDTDGVTISGEVQSYNPKNPVEIKLYRLNEDVMLYDSSQTYQTEITAAEFGSGLVTQRFYIQGVEPGTYRLVVSKKTHLSYTIEGLRVGTEDMDITKRDEAFISLITLLCGDIDSDESIDLVDRGVLLSYDNYNKSTEKADEMAQNPDCDLDGDGMIDLIDNGILLSSGNYNKNYKDSYYVIS